jgi:hypothetical protein
MIFIQNQKSHFWFRKIGPKSMGPKKAYHLNLFNCFLFAKMFSPLLFHTICTFFTFGKKHQHIVNTLSNNANSWDVFVYTWLSANCKYQISIASECRQCCHETLHDFMYMVSYLHPNSCLWYIYIKTSQEFALFDRVLTMCWCFFPKVKKVQIVWNKSGENILAKRKQLKRFRWYAFFGPIDFGPIFLNQKWLF